MAKLNERRLTEGQEKFLSEFSDFAHRRIGDNGGKLTDTIHTSVGMLMDFLQGQGFQIYPTPKGDMEIKTPDTPLTDLNITVRLYNILRARFPKDAPISDIAKTPLAELMRWRNVGKKTLTEFE